MGYAAAVARVREATSGCPVVVFDLDGVVRHFSARAGQPTPESGLGLPEGTWLATAFEQPHLGQVVTGEITFAQWCERITALLVERGSDPDRVSAAMRRWVEDRGTPVTETVALIEQIRAQGRSAFVFTNGTDNVPAELCQMGLGWLVDRLLNSADFGVAKPDPGAFAAAHAAIEVALERPVRRSEVGFTDDRVGNIAAAAEFGWVSLHFDVTG